MKILLARIRLIPKPQAALLFALIATSLLGTRALAQKPTIDITAYNIDAQIDPDAHSLKATARVTFTPLQALDTVVFQLHGALKVDKVTDGANNVLSGERGNDATIRLTLPATLAKGQSTTFTFEYGGVLTGAEPSPIEGLKLASIGSPISYLLYPARWFPMHLDTCTDRFTADIRVTVPLGYRVSFGSGGAGPLTQSGGTFEFRWSKPGFPGTIIAGKFNPPLPRALPAPLYVFISGRPTPGRPQPLTLLTPRRKSSTTLLESSAPLSRCISMSWNSPTILFPHSGRRRLPPFLADG